MSDVTLRQAAATSSSLVTMISTLDAMQSELQRTLLNRLQTSKQTSKPPDAGKVRRRHTNLYEGSNVHLFTVLLTSLSQTSVIEHDVDRTCNLTVRRNSKYSAVNCVDGLSKTTTSSRTDISSDCCCLLERDINRLGK
jgi:hypothetical protein